MTTIHRETPPLFGSRRLATARARRRWLLATVLALVPIACDSASEGAASKEGAKAEPSASAAAKDAMKAVDDLKAELAAGESIHLGCAGNLGAYDSLAGSSADDEKKAHQALLDVCFVEAPTKMLADLRAKLGKDEYDGFDAVDLETLLGNDKCPKDGAAAEVAADVRKFLDVEVPTHQLGKHTATAKQEKADGETVSMGCIEGKQVVDKSRDALAGDPDGKAALDAYTEVCPAKP